MDNHAWDAIMAEYTALRTESRDKQKMQFTILSLIVSAISIVFGLTATVKINEAKSFLLVLYLFLLPCTIMFFGILWLDQVYRQVMIGTYIAHIEEKINKILTTDASADMPYVYWEHWLSKRRPTHEFFNKPNYYYTYICLGTLLVLPVATYVIGSVLTDCPINGWGAISIVAFLIYGRFIHLYVAAIQSMDCQIESSTLSKMQN